ncbi:MAG: Nucleotidyltransferase domain protein [bacterium ADurb.Bin243]|nr:MAG: Nucleotidyltransferase domain protein [bacterium ADurb.Bin243]
MRLSEFEVKSIKESIRVFDPDALVYLFGSRTDDSKKGGDIDILVLSEKLTSKEKRLIKLDLYDKIGEQKIDIIISKNGVKSPFVKLAVSGGVIL